MKSKVLKTPAKQKAKDTLKNKVVRNLGKATKSLPTEKEIDNALGRMMNNTIKKNGIQVVPGSDIMKILNS